MHDGSDGSSFWKGDSARLYHNEARIGILEHGFQHLEVCLPLSSVNILNDEFKIIAGGNDGVS